MQQALAGGHHILAAAAPRLVSEQISLSIALPSGGSAALLAPLTIVRWSAHVPDCPVYLPAGGAERRAADVWLCGYIREADVYRYGAHNLYTEVKRYFHWVGGMPRHHHEAAPETKTASTTLSSDTYGSTRCPEQH